VPILLTKQDYRKEYKQKASDRAKEKYKIHFPIRASSELAKIVAYLTFDGHLSASGSMLLFTAGKINNLKCFSELFEETFHCQGRVAKVSTNEYGESYEYRVFSKPIGRMLKLIGVPGGEKVKTTFHVPLWIKTNKEFSRAYLQAAFDCEGSIWHEKTRIRVRFSNCKVKELSQNASEFMQEITDMLAAFGICTTNLWSTKGCIRKDGKETRCFIFGIKDKSIGSFKEHIGFKIPEKARQMGL
jgi:DNA-binding transcriptional regulator WhiA